MARKNSCPHTCKDVINTMYGYNAMEVQEAFNKICEQARPPSACDPGTAPSLHSRTPDHSHGKCMAAATSEYAQRH